jgi:hypothetical protein
VHLEKTLRHPAPPAAVAALLADRGFVEEVCAASGATTWEVAVEGDAAGAFTVTSSRTLPTDDLPDAARRFVGASIHLREVDRWEPPAPDGTRRGSLELEVPGSPVVARASLVLRPQGDGSAQQVTGEITASVPLVGSRIEKMAAGPLLQALDDLEQIAGRRLRG